MRRLARWQLHFPKTEADLAALLDAGYRQRRCCGWASRPNTPTARTAARPCLAGLDSLLNDQQRHRVIAVTTMWREHWDDYTEAARTHAGLGQARAAPPGQLLGQLPELTGHDPALIDAARGGVIDIPQSSLPPRSSTPPAPTRVLADAARAAAECGDDGQIAQYLAGVPDLLDRYQVPGGNPYGRAIITAAMDAARLGHDSPLPKPLLLHAAPGYLSDRERARDTPSWRKKEKQAWKWATKELRGAFQAVQPVPHPRGTGPAGLPARGLP